MLQCKKFDVDGTFSKCAGCRMLKYCSKDCQKVDWKQGHRGLCKELATMDEQGSYLCISRRLRVTILTCEQITKSCARIEDIALCLQHRRRADIYKEYAPYLIQSFREDVRRGSDFGYIDLPRSTGCIVTRGLARQCLPDDRTHGARRIELPINASGDVSLSSDGLTWMQVFLPEGDTTVGVILKTKLQGDGFYTSSPDKRTSRLCRSAAVDQAGRKLTKRWDEVDEILHHLNFRRADEWYSSGPGSIDQLNRRVEAIMMELRML